MVLTRRRGVVGILVGTMLAFVVLLFRTGAPASAATTWNTGDVFVAVGNGSYNVYNNAGVFKQTITSPLGATTTGAGRLITSGPELMPIWRLTSSPVSGASS